MVHRFCLDYSKNPHRGRTLTISGENGSGKSHVAKRVHHWANRISMNIPQVHSDTGLKLADCRFVSWPEVVDGFKRGEWEIVDDLFDVALLVIDDIGAEYDPSKVGMEKLYLILSRREKRWNIITTNVKPEQWENNFERRVASRLFRNAEHSDLSQVPDFSTI